jgi:hypothetical protein
MRVYNSEQRCVQSWPYTPTEYIYRIQDKSLQKPFEGISVVSVPAKVKLPQQD